MTTMIPNYYDPDDQPSDFWGGVWNAVKICSLVWIAVWLASLAAGCTTPRAAATDTLHITRHDTTERVAYEYRDRFVGSDVVRTYTLTPLVTGGYDTLRTDTRQRIVLATAGATHDTLRVVRTDTVYRAREVVRERQRTFAERVQEVWLPCLLACLCVVLALVAAAGWRKKA